MLGDTMLEYTVSEKDLGVVVTSTCSWDEQCQAILNISSSRLGMIKRVCNFSKNIKQKRALYLAIVRSHFEHCSIIWRPTSDTTINKFESIQKRAVKWILNEQYHHYNDWEYTCRLRDLNILPIRYYFIFNDLIIFHKIYNDSYCVKLPSYLRLCNSEDRSRLRSNINPPDYFNSPRSMLDLSTMRAISLDDKSLRCTITSTSVVFKNSFFFRSHMLWNYLPLNTRDEICPKKFRSQLLVHLWEEVMKPD